MSTPSDFADVVDRCRFVSKIERTDADGSEWAADTLECAADEIERLRTVLRRIADAHVTFYSEIAREGLAAQNA